MAFLRSVALRIFDMVKLKYTFLALVGLTWVSCAAPKATLVPQPPVAPKKEKPVETPVVSEAPSTPALPDDGLRAPNMLELPSDGELRSANPSAPKVGEGGAVTSRPPTDPPVRVKPKEETPAGQR